MKVKLTFPWKIFLIAVVLRLIPVLLTRSLGIGLDDMFQYDMLARSLSSGNGFRWYAYEDLKMLEPYVDFDLSSVDYDPVRGVATSFRAPLYPAFLAVIYYITGAGSGRFVAVRIVQAILNALIAPLTYLISRRLFPDHEPASVASAWIVTCYPMLILFPIGLATENLFIFFVLLSYFYLLKSFEKPSFKLFVVTGFILGLTALTRSVITVFVGLILIWFWFRLKGHRLKVIVLFLTFLLTITPWIARNSFLHKSLSGIETAMGYQLYVGYHPKSSGTFIFDVSLDLIPILDDAKRDQIGKKKALEFILADPPRVIKLAINRLGYFLGIERRAATYFYSNNFFGYIPRHFLILIAVMLFTPFILIAVTVPVGLAIRRFSPEIELLLLLMIGYTFPHLLIISEERFHLMLIPFFAILSTQAWKNGFHKIMSRWHESRAGKVAVSLAALAIMMLLLNWGLELWRDADKISTLLSIGGNKLYFPY